MQNNHTRGKTNLQVHDCIEGKSGKTVSGKTVGGKTVGEKSAYRKLGYSIVIEELVVLASIGIYPHERKKKQPLVISLKLNINTEINAEQAGEQGFEQAGEQAGGDKITIENSNFLCYKKLCDGVKKVVARGHIELLEDLSEMLLGEILAQCCLARSQAQSIWLSLKKTQAIEGAKAVGIELSWQRK